MDKGNFLSKFEVLDRIKYLNHSAFSTECLRLDQQMYFYNLIKLANKLSLAVFILFTLGSLAIYISLFSDFVSFLYDLGDIGYLINAGIFILIVITWGKIVSWVERLYLESKIKDFKLENLQNKNDELNQVADQLLTSEVQKEVDKIRALGRNNKETK